MIILLSNRAGRSDTGYWIYLAITPRPPIFAIAKP